jgi:hypothetical protein
VVGKATSRKQPAEILDCRLVKGADQIRCLGDIYGSKDPHTEH